MSVIVMRPARKPQARKQATRNKRVYAIAFDLNTKTAEQLCGDGWRNCYAQIGLVLAEFGFSRQQGSVYFGDENSDAVKCVMAVQEIDRRHAWFSRVVQDLRMLRVDEDNDLLPALSSELRLGKGAVA
jgi:virulence-associated protein VapD